jgi:cytoskeleton-associated protein 5
MEFDGFGSGNQKKITYPKQNVQGLEYLALVFQLLTEWSSKSSEPLTLHDIEANSFIPFLVVKIGDPKDQIRHSCRTILKHLCKLYPASKLFVFLTNGLATKNAKQRAECLEEMGALIRASGLGVCGPQPALALREMAKQIADRDNAVRSAALNAVTEAYFQEGERLYKMIGNLPEKDMDMLEERIKR